MCPARLSKDVTTFPGRDRVSNTPFQDGDGSGGGVADYCRGAGFPIGDAEAARTLATALILDAV